MKKEVLILFLALASFVSLNCAAQVRYTPELDEFIGEWHHNSSAEKVTIRIVRKGDTIKLFFKTYWLIPELHEETTYYTVNSLSFNDGVMTWFEIHNGGY